MYKSIVIIGFLFLVSSDVFSAEKCKYLSGLSEGSSQTQIRDAYVKCKEMSEHKLMLVEAQKALKKAQAELKGGVSSSSKSESPSQEQDKIDIQKMLNSEKVFLLSSSGRKGTREVEIFYKGATYFVKEGSMFPGGKLISSKAGSALFKKNNGKKETSFLTTVDEMKVSLGISAQKKKRKAIPLGFSAQ
jgi:hypothetical protein